MFSLCKEMKPIPDLIVQKRSDDKLDILERETVAITPEEMELLQKKAALERLEVAINTFTDEACFLDLSNDGNTVTIHFISGRRKTVNIHCDSGIAMLYDVLRQGFIE